MTRRADDSPNWGGPRPGGGRKFSGKSRTLKAGDTLYVERPGVDNIEKWQVLSINQDGRLTIHDQRTGEIITMTIGGTK